MSEKKIVSRKNLTFYKGFSILDGKLFSGVCVDYYNNGQKESEGQCKDGNQVGLWTYWHENGQKRNELHFKDEIHNIP